MKVFRISLNTQLLASLNSYSQYDDPSTLELLEKIYQHQNFGNYDSDKIFEDIFLYFFEEAVKENNGLWQKGWSAWKGINREKIVIFNDDNIRFRGLRGWKKYFTLEQVVFSYL